MVRYRHGVVAQGFYFFYERRNPDRAIKKGILAVYVKMNKTHWCSLGLNSKNCLQMFGLP